MTASGVIIQICPMRVAPLVPGAASCFYRHRCGNSIGTLPRARVFRHRRARLAGNVDNPGAVPFLKALELYRVQAQNLMRLELPRSACCTILEVALTLSAQRVGGFFGVINDLSNLPHCFRRSSPRPFDIRRAQSIPYFFDAQSRLYITGPHEITLCCIFELTHN